MIILISSCKGTKNIQKEDYKSNSIINIIYDFSNFEKNEKGCAYKIKLLKKTENIDCYLISKAQLYFPKIEDSIGAKTKSFPTNSLEIKHRLYLWDDYENPISKEMIKSMTKYRLFDSTSIKDQRGDNLTNNKTPLIYTNEKEMSVFYFVCKNNYKKFVKRKSNFIIKENDYPNINCD